MHWINFSIRAALLFIFRPILFFGFGLGLLVLFLQGSSYCQTRAFWDSLREKPGAKPEQKILSSLESPKASIDLELNRALDSLAQSKRKMNKIRGFRILLYSGNDRELATKAKAQGYKVFPKADVYTQYNVPTFKVRLGDYYQKLEAYKALGKLKPYFPAAVIVEEVVNLKI